MDASIRIIPVPTILRRTVSRCSRRQPGSSRPVRETEEFPTDVYKFPKATAVRGRKTRKLGGIKWCEMKLDRPGPRSSGGRHRCSFAINFIVYLARCSESRELACARHRALCLSAIVYDRLAETIVLVEHFRAPTSNPLSLVLERTRFIASSINPI